MKTSLITLLLLLGAYTITIGQNTTWNLDKSHSNIGFAVGHLVISETSGKFDDYALVVKSDKPDFTDAAFTLTIQTKSINTSDAERDKHLRGEDFFDAEKYPTITFKGKKFTKVKDNLYKITGDLTMHGVTKTVTLDAKFNGIIKDPWGGTRTGIKVWGEIDRYDYNLKYNSVLESGGLAIGQTVELNCQVELIKAG